jgi:intergrase/recombinase
MHPPKPYYNKHALFIETSEKIGIKITPQVLREWFACEMGRLGVPDRYVDAFCGRVPRTVLARHYTEFGPERLKEIYDRANLRVLSETLPK